MVNKINIGIIGYGFMGKTHSFAYKVLPMFFKTNSVPVMKAICGRNKSLVEDASKLYGWERYETDWKKLVESSDIDLIDISTPNDTHKEIAIAAAKAGKHILCEKPLALNLSEAKEMLSAVKKAGTKHMVCFNYQKSPAFSLARQLIDEGRIGRIYHFRAVYLQDWAIDPMTPCVWRFDKNIAGSGVLGDLLSHTIQMARYLVGEFSEVTGMQETIVTERPEPKQKSAYIQGSDVQMNDDSDKKFSKITVDDSTLFLARFKNGALGSFESTRYAQGRKNGMRIEVNGEKGSIVFEQEDMNILWFYSADDPKEIRGFRRIQATEPCHPYMSAWWPVGHIIGYENTFVHAIYDFMKAIDEDTIPVPNFIDGVEVQRVLEAVEISIKEQGWIKINSLL